MARQDEDEKFFVAGPFLPKLSIAKSVIIKINKKGIVHDKE